MYFIIKVITGEYSFELLNSKKVSGTSEAKPFGEVYLANFSQIQHSSRSIDLYRPYILPTKDAIAEVKDQLSKNGKRPLKKDNGEISLFEIEHLDTQNLPFAIPLHNIIYTDNGIIGFNGDAYICNQDGKTIEHIHDCRHISPKGYVEPSK